MVAYGGVWNGFDWWWLLPIAMMVLCFLYELHGHVGCMLRKVRSPQGGDSAREILDKRYALGEISKEEYDEKKRDIA